MKRITTDAEWLASDEPNRMVWCAGERVGLRKCRLLAAGCFRLMWDALPDPRSRAAVERFADDPAAEDGVRRAYELAHEAGLERTGDRDLAARAASVVLWYAYAQVRLLHFKPHNNAQSLFANLKLTRVGERPLRRRMADLVRCVAGNPFRPAAPLAPAWRTPTAVAVARGIYDGRTFHDLPVLADALEDAGC